MSNVREAAERLRDHESGGDPYPFDGGARQMGDERTLALAYLAEHPADEDEPVTEEWLRKMGFHDDPQPDSVTCLYWEYERGWLLSKGVHDQWYIYGNELPEESWPKTRGQLRRLLNGLGIETKA